MTSVRQRAKELAESIIRDMNGKNLADADIKKVEELLGRLERLSEAKLGSISW
jgi:acyl-CoA reductase-like NAD-dependent aldehyde dehydrogenase